MKRFYQLAAVAVVALSVPVAISSPVSAAFVCEEGFTGPQSGNVCVSDQTYKCTLINDTEIKISGVTDQDAVSGSAEVNSNRTGGTAQTGDVANNNVTRYTLKIDNGGSEEETCLASKVVPAKEVPEQPEEPEAPERPVGGSGSAPTPAGGSGSAPVQPARTAAPTALPVTSGEAAPKVAVLTTSGAAIVAAIALAYRRLNI